MRQGLTIRKLVHEILGSKIGSLILVPIPTLTSSPHPNPNI